MNHQFDTHGEHNQNGTETVARCADMPSITLKNIPEELYKRLKQSAERNRRSINGEAIFCLESALRSSRPTPPDLIARIRELNTVAQSNLTADEIVQMIRADRDDPDR